jgi:DNA processing protein
VDILDPRDASARPILEAWLRVQRRYALHPEELPPAVRRARAPADVLAAAELLGASDPRARRECELLARLGVRALPIASPAYPERLRTLVDAPPLVVVRGNPALFAVRAVAIVGARAATVYGREIARELAAAAGRAGLLVVSGLARGIDACAHEAALEAGGASLAWLPCGIDRLYPPDHKRLSRALVAGGALASEFPLGTPPRAAHFPLRNRLISALADAVVVVEAREHSGSLVTARHAGTQGRDVLAVPGSIRSPTSIGPHRLLRDGAGLVTSAADLLEALGLPAPRAAMTPARTPGPERDPLLRRIARALRAEPLSRDALAAQIGLGADAIAAALAQLELAGDASQDRDGRWVARATASEPRPGRL